MADFESRAQRDRGPATRSSQEHTPFQGSATTHVFLALQRSIGNHVVGQLLRSCGAAGPAAQGPMIRRVLERAKMNIVGEAHLESDERRSDEHAMLKSAYNFSAEQYWAED